MWWSPRGLGVRPAAAVKDRATIGYAADICVAAVMAAALTLVPADADAGKLTASP